MDSSAFNGYVDRITGGLAIALAISICGILYLVFK